MICQNGQLKNYRRHIGPQKGYGLPKSELLSKDTVLFMTQVSKRTECVRWVRLNSGRFILIYWQVILKSLDIFFLTDVPKSPNRLLGILTLPPIYTLTGTLTQIQFPSYTVIQITEPLDVATNMFFANFGK